MNPATVDSLALKNKQLDEIEVSFVVFKELRQIDLSQNRIRFPRQLENALAAPVLEDLDLSGNPIAKELADFRLYIIAHSANTLRVLNGEPVSDAERCRAWLAFPALDPLKNHALQARLALPITDAVMDAYAAVAREAQDEVAAAALRADEAARAAEREAVARRAQVLADRKKIEEERAAEEIRVAEQRANHARLLAEAREADRQVAAAAGLISEAEVAVKASPIEVNPISPRPQAVAAPVAAPAVVESAVPTPSIDDIFGTAPAVAAVPVATASIPQQQRATTDANAAAGGGGGLWWTDAPIGAVLSEVEGIDDAPLDLASVAERARAKAAERKRAEAETLAKMQAVQAAREQGERTAMLEREREAAAAAEKTRQERLARERADAAEAQQRAEREAREVAARRAHEVQEQARAEQRRRDEAAAKREQERVERERAEAERERVARAAQEASERARREAEESRLRDEALQGPIFSESVDDLRKAVERHERQVEALRNAGAHLVALDKAEEKLEKARRRLAQGGAPEPASEPSASSRAVPQTKTLDTRLAVPTSASRTIFDDVFDSGAPKTASKPTKRNAMLDDLFDAI